MERPDHPFLKNQYLFRKMERFIFNRGLSFFVLVI